MPRRICHPERHRELPGNQREALLRARPDQRPDQMAPLQKMSDQRTADVSGAAGDKHAMGLRIHRLPLFRHHTQAKVRVDCP